MRAYKGFNKDLTCTMGAGTFQYKIGKTFTASKAKCANTGLHCVEEPIEVLTWYDNKDSRWCVVEAAGDINEDGDMRISCTEMTIIREVTIEQLGMLECLWIKAHPERITSRHIKSETGRAAEDHIVIVRGKKPKASGMRNSTLFILQEEKDSPKIAEIGVFKIDGDCYEPNVYYSVTGKKVRKDA